MPEEWQKRWTKYSVSKLNQQELPSIAHVTHVNNALEILRVGCIKPQLIYDESRLNRRRILVVWLSPNDWTPVGGFRYGNIAFDLDWKHLVKNKNYYWIGVMPYSPPACRLLVTKKDRSEKLKPYLPARGDGPWRANNKTKKHYWNAKCCLEILLEEEIPLGSVSALRFVKHNRNQCCIDAYSCPDRGHNDGKGAARLLAGACDRRLLSNTPDLWIEDNKPNECLLFAWQQLQERLCAGIKKWAGAVSAESKRAPAIARAAMGMLCDQSEKDRQHLFSLFDTEESVIEVCATVIEDDLELATGTLPRE
jgi:hypothetical protein